MLKFLFPNLLLNQTSILKFDIWQNTLHHLQNDLPSSPLDSCPSHHNLFSPFIITLSSPKSSIPKITIATILKKIPSQNINLNPPIFPFKHSFLNWSLTPFIFKNPTHPVKKPMANNNFYSNRSSHHHNRNSHPL
mgnify:CR=1 FL=1